MTLTKKVRFVDSVATTADQFKRGDTYDLEPRFANTMVKSGAAVEVHAGEPATEADGKSPKPRTVK